MELIGKYKKSVTDFRTCKVLIQNGIVHSVVLDNAKPIDYFDINPKENAEFEYRKLPSPKGLAPIEANYKIQYENNNGETNTVYVKLSNWKLIKIKLQKGECILQSKELKIEILKYGVISILTLLVGLFTAQRCTAIHKPNKNESIVKKESDSLNKSLVKKDTLRSE